MQWPNTDFLKQSKRITNWAKTCGWTFSLHASPAMLNSSLVSSIYLLINLVFSDLIRIRLSAWLAILLIPDKMRRISFWNVLFTFDFISSRAEWKLRKDCMCCNNFLWILEISICLHSQELGFNLEKNILLSQRDFWV